MNPELPDLEPHSPTRDLADQESGQFSIILLVLGVLAPLLLVYISVISGQRLWLTLLNLVCTYAGLAVVIVGWRRKRRRLVNLGAAGMFLSCMACLATLSLLS
jgi:hypothetical protein